MSDPPAEDLTLVIRTDFNDAVWSAVCKTIQKPGDLITRGLKLVNTIYAALCQEGLGDGVGEF